MTRACDLTGKTIQAGNNVSHSNRKTRRRFLPNIHNVTIKSDALDRNVSLKLTAATIRSIDHNGGLDNYLVTAKAHNLTEEGQKLRRQVKKVLAANAA
jgi:large subunit ribosomal protein L28